MQFQQIIRLNLPYYILGRISWLKWPRMEAIMTYLYSLPILEQMAQPMEEQHALVLPGEIRSPLIEGMGQTSATTSTLPSGLGVLSPTESL